MRSPRPAAVRWLARGGGPRIKSGLVGPGPPYLCFMNEILAFGVGESGRVVVDRAREVAVWQADDVVAD